VLYDFRNPENSITNKILHQMTLHLAKVKLFDYFAKYIILDIPL
jgi:hypothetical protein